MTKKKKKKKQALILLGTPCNSFEKPCRAPKLRIYNVKAHILPSVFRKFTPVGFIYLFTYLEL